jgi:hypothetical protein
MSFEDGSVTNFILVQLADGTTFKALITDETAVVLVEARARMGGLPSAPRPQPPPRPAPVPPQARPTRPAQPDPPETDDDGAVVFGGDAGDTDDDADESAPAFWPGPARVQGTDQQEPPPPPAVDPALASTDPQVQAAAYRRDAAEKKKNRVRNPTIGRQVQKDALGYPTVRGDGADPNAVIGPATGPVDEDGVGQF